MIELYIHFDFFGYGTPTNKVPSPLKSDLDFVPDLPR